MPPILSSEDDILPMAEEGLQAEIDLGRFEELRGLSSDVWAQLLAMAAPPPPPAPPSASPAPSELARVEHSHDLGIHVWRAAASLAICAHVAPPASASASASSPSGSSSGLRARELLGDEALKEYARCCFGEE